MTQSLYASKRSRNARAEWDISSWSLKYVLAAEFLSKYVRFMTMDVYMKKKAALWDNARVELENERNENRKL